jgi:putative heme-binding domain-containing protein
MAVSQLLTSDLTDLTTEVSQLITQPLDDDVIHRLSAIDSALAGHSPGSASLSETKHRILNALATSQQENGLVYVRSIFENAPERRGSAAAALAAATTLRPTELQDWTFMVRSLPVVQGDEAGAVLNALQRFRNRANKGQWIRQVILVGLQLPPDQQAAATSLLRHWTGMPLKKTDAAAWTLQKYQEWFSKEYPDQPKPELPVDSADRKWTMATLEKSVLEFITTDAMKQQGERVYEKAGCQKCHRRGKVGESLGPDLTSLGWRRQRREILVATLFPSHELNEEYPTVTVSLKNGKTLTGMLSASSAETLAIVSSTGMRQEFPRTDIEDIVNQKVSNMPEGLLEPLTRDEILSLMAWLSSVDGVPHPHADEGP